jgi:hypothetical protein
VAKIVVVAKCKDQAKWEAGFKTHGDVFKSYTVSKPIGYGMGDDNTVVACFEPDDLEAAMKGIGSPATAEAMEFDGLLQDTVSIFVLDKELRV